MENILQWNCRGIRANLPELQLLIKNFSPMALCLSETMLADNNIKIDNNYHSHFKNVTSANGRSHGGVGILTHKSLAYSIITLQTNLQAIAIRLTLHKTVTICSIYLPPSNPIDPNNLNALFQQLPSPFLLLGDFNAHSPIWGCKHLDSRGRIIEDLISNNNLCFLNNKNITYIHPATGSSSAIDLSLCTAAIVPHFTWAVHDDLCGSDHFPVFIKLTKPIPVSKPVRWKLHKADWLDFETRCKELLTNYQTINNITQFTETLISISNATISKTSGKLSKRKPPWFDKECHQTIKERQRALRQFQNNHTTENLTKYKIQRAKTRRIIKQSKRTSWQAYVTKLSTNTTREKFGR